VNDFDLPPGAKWRQFEILAQGFREFARVQPNAPLNPFRLAKFANLLVLDFEQIKGLSEQTRKHLLGDASDKWSGGAASQPLPDGRRIVILNPNHNPMRTHATLMEEISHVFLGHQPSRLKISAKDSRGRSISRDYRNADEEQAYATGAAALVPYGALRRFVHQGKKSAEIAKHFRVSRELVEYRIKVTRLWSLYKPRQTEP
jgi:IrrE N-terminal-like domain